MRPVSAAIVGAVRRVPAARTLVVCASVAAWWVCLPGCGGHASIDIVDLNFSRMTKEGPVVRHVQADVAVWWVDRGQLCVAMRRHRNAVWGELSRGRFDLSFVLDGVPAAESRDYRIEGPAMRCYHHEGGSHVRYRSVRGIVSVWTEPGQALRGKFRVSAGRESFHILTSWSRVGSAVLAGEFLAMQGPDVGQSILQASEENGMGRPPPGNTDQDEAGKPVQVTGPPVEP